MYAMIGRYQEGNVSSEQFAQAARHLAASLSQVPGFVSYLVLRTQSDVLVSVSIFEDKAGLAEADRLVGTLLAEHLDIRLPGHREVTTGEVVFQRGL